MKQQMMIFSQFVLRLIELAKRIDCSNNHDLSRNSKDSMIKLRQSIRPQFHFSFTDLNSHPNATPVLLQAAELSSIAGSYTSNTPLSSIQ
jgi:hypothetical protein